MAVLLHVVSTRATSAFSVAAYVMWIRFGYDGC